MLWNNVLLAMMNLEVRKASEGKTLGEVVVREPVRSVTKRTGRDLNPLNLSVICHVLRTGSQVCFDVL